MFLSSMLFNTSHHLYHLVYNTFMNEIDLTSLKEALEKSWSRDTAYKSVRNKWSIENKSFGQCAVTALLVNKYYGGEIYKADVLGEGYSHFWNILQDGALIDLTRPQFGNKKIRLVNIKKKTPEELLKNEDLKERYELLNNCVEKNIKP